jgi:hypothetical protein
MFIREVSFHLASTPLLFFVACQSVSVPGADSLPKAMMANLIAAMKTTQLSCVSYITAFGQSANMNYLGISVGTDRATIWHGIHPFSLLRSCLFFGRGHKIWSPPGEQMSV